MPALCLALLLAAPAALPLEPTPIAEGVWALIRPETLRYPVEGNITLIVGEDDVVVVDSGRTPAAASAAIEAIRSLTPKPVRTLVNSHWHGDHHHGNARFREAFPGLTLIGHATTREDVETLGRESLEGQLELAGDRERLAERLAEAESGERPLRPDVQHRVRQLLAQPASYYDELRAVELLPPTLGFEGRLTLWQGARPIQLRADGPGNTRGDTVVYLPRERVVITGDLLVPQVPFMSESRPRAWLERLDQIAALDWVVLVPGHGAPQRDRTRLELTHQLLRSLIEQVDAAIAAGHSLDQAQSEVDLGRFRSAFAGDDAYLAHEFDYRVTHTAVRAAWLEARPDAASDSAGGAAPDAAALRAEALRLERALEALLQDPAAADLIATGESLGRELARLKRALDQGRRFEALLVWPGAAIPIDAASWALRHVDAPEQGWAFVAARVERARGAGARPLAPAPLQALSDRARSAAPVYLRSARAMLKEPQSLGARYYQGAALAWLELAERCEALGVEPRAEPPRSDGLAPALAALESELGAAYAEPGAAIERHSEFIAGNASLKEARALYAQGHSLGALERLLDGRLRLHRIRGAALEPDSAAELRARADAGQARLDALTRLDHSLARALLDLARGELARVDAETDGGPDGEPDDDVDNDVDTDARRAATARLAAFDDYFPLIGEDAR